MAMVALDGLHGLSSNWNNSESIFWIENKTALCSPKEILLHLLFFSMQEYSQTKAGTLRTAGMGTALLPLVK